MNESSQWLATQKAQSSPPAILPSFVHSLFCTNTSKRVPKSGRGWETETTTSTGMHCFYGGEYTV